ncbi:MAG: nitroreductase family protein, partial [Candidatus Solibacter usitatus]|nr:nitroreductase family protein [Candidatus Solibacter usitatus]
IAWREAWKYRSRAYRYCLLDIGHASEALILAARWLNCQATVIVDFDDDAIAAACGLAADEWPLLLIALTGLPAEKRAAPPEEWYGGSPNPLSPEVLDYPLITQMHQCSKEGGAALQNCAQPTDRPVLKDFATIARRRRSALDFRGGGETIALDQYSTLLDQAAGARFIQLYSYVHRVRGLERGLYRGTTLLKTGDQRLMAAALSLGQDLAGNSCVTFSMVADLERAFRDFGNRGYRYVHFEAGAIGQRLYLASEAMGFGSTGIGAFYDDDVHAYLGVKHVIYHFACGYPVEDARLTK